VIADFGSFSLNGVLKGVPAAWSGEMKVRYFISYLINSCREVSTLQKMEEPGVVVVHGSLKGK
jgi:hypothetical protein